MITEVSAEHHARVRAIMRRYHVGAAVLVVAATALLLFGYRFSTLKAHDEELARRAESISADIAFHFEKTGSLPLALNEVDTKQDTAGLTYEYVDAARYRMCMTFKTKLDASFYSEKEPSYLYINSHPAGYHCVTVRPQPSGYRPGVSR